MALNMRNFLIILTLCSLISACAADGKGLIGRFLTEAGKVAQAQLDVDKFALKDAAALLQQAANNCI